MQHAVLGSAACAGSANALPCTTDAQCAEKAAREAGRDDVNLVWTQLRGLNAHLEARAARQGQMAFQQHDPQSGVPSSSAPSAPPFPWPGWQVRAAVCLPAVNSPFPVGRSCAPAGAPSTLKHAVEKAKACVPWHVVVVQSLGQASAAGSADASFGVPHSCRLVIYADCVHRWRLQMPWTLGLRGPPRTSSQPHTRMASRSSKAAIPVQLRGPPARMELGTGSTTLSSQVRSRLKLPAAGVKLKLETRVKRRASVRVYLLLWLPSRLVPQYCLIGCCS